MYNPMSLEDRKIIITGGASGIGQAAAQLVCELGGDVLLLDINEAGIRETLSKCSKNSKGRQVDLCNGKSMEEVLKEEVTQMGKFDGLVHCAGLASVVPLRALSRQSYEQVMTVNVTAALELAKLFSGKRINSGDNPSIVFISSVYGVVGSACNVAYATSKAAIIGMTKSLGIELAPKNIRVNCIAPGFIKTNMSKQVESKFDDSYSDVVEKLHPLGWGKESDIANGIAYLLSNASRWMTGSIMSIDGGYTAQ